MTNFVGNGVRYYQKFRFVFQIEGIDVAGFQSAGPLKQEVSVVEQHEGGAQTAVDISPGKLKTEKLSLVRGASDNTELFDWWVAIKSGKLDKRNCALVQQDGEGNPIQRWPLNDCFPSSYEAGDWDAKADTENLMEKVEITYIDFDRKAA